MQSQMHHLNNPSQIMTTQQIIQMSTSRHKKRRSNIMPRELPELNDPPRPVTKQEGAGIKRGKKVIVGNPDH